MSEIKLSISEVQNRLQVIFSRHIARALGAMEIGDASQTMKAAIKGEFWNTMDDVKAALGMGESQVGVKKCTGDT